MVLHFARPLYVDHLKKSNQAIVRFDTQQEAELFIKKIEESCKGVNEEG